MIGKRKCGVAWLGTVANNSVVFTIWDLGNGLHIIIVKRRIIESDHVVLFAGPM
jgi:hypothetical protein